MPWDRHRSHIVRSGQPIPVSRRFPVCCPCTHSIHSLPGHSHIPSTRSTRRRPVIPSHPHTLETPLPSFRTSSHHSYSSHFFSFPHSHRLFPPSVPPPDPLDLRHPLDPRSSIPSRLLSGRLSLPPSLLPHPALSFLSLSSRSSCAPDLQLPSSSSFLQVSHPALHPCTSTLRRLCALHCQLPFHPFSARICAFGFFLSPLCCLNSAQTSGSASTAQRHIRYTRPLGTNHTHTHIQHNLHLHSTKTSID